MSRLRLRFLKNGEGVGRPVSPSSREFSKKPPRLAAVGRLHDGRELPYPHGSGFGMQTIMEGVAVALESLLKDTPPAGTARDTPAHPGPSKTAALRN